MTPSSKASNHNRYYRPLHMFKSVRFSFLSVWHAKVVHSSFPQPFCLKPTCAHCNSHASMNVEITRRRALTTGSQAHAERSLNSTYEPRINSIGEANQPRAVAIDEPTWSNWSTPLTVRAARGFRLFCLHENWSRTSTSVITAIASSAACSNA